MAYDLLTKIFTVVLPAVESQLIGTSRSIHAETDCNLDHASALVHAHASQRDFSSDAFTARRCDSGFFAMHDLPKYTTSRLNWPLAASSALPGHDGLRLCFVPYCKNLYFCADSSFCLKVPAFSPRGPQSVFVAYPGLALEYSMARQPGNVWIHGGPESSPYRILQLWMFRGL